MSDKSKPQPNDISTDDDVTAGETATDRSEAAKKAERLRADKAAQALHSQWAQEDANRTARQREADRERWQDPK